MYVIKYASQLISNLMPNNFNPLPFVYLLQKFNKQFENLSIKLQQILNPFIYAYTIK